MIAPANRRPVPAAAGTVRLVAVNGTPGERVEVLRSLGRAWTLGAVRTVKATVVGLDGTRCYVECDADVAGITRAWCACGSVNPLGCYHARAAYRAAGGQA